MKWEYCSRTIGVNALSNEDFEKDLDFLGQKGWELVTAVPGPLGLKFIFKRPLP